MTLYQNTLGVRVYLFVFIRLILDGVAAFKFLLAGEFANIIAIVKAHWYFFTRFIAIRKKRALIAKNLSSLQIGPDTVRKGMFPKSIVWAHFFKGKKTFNDLNN